MAFSRILTVPFLVAAFFACAGLCTGAAAADIVSGAPVAGHVNAWDQPALEPSDITDGEAADLVPACPMPEQFADGATRGLSLALIEEVRRMRSLDDVDGLADKTPHLTARWRTHCSACWRQLELLLTLSSLHVRLQV
jgi:hypothetical protein